MKKSKFKRLAQKCGIAVGVVAGGIPFVNHSAFGQSPGPNWYMMDINSSQAFPSGANASVVEALGMIGKCNFAPYTPAEVVSKIVSLIRSNDGISQTILEISPQSYCDPAISDYISSIDSVVAQIYSAVGSNAFSRYFGGVMLDDEPGFGFNASQLETLNVGIQPNIFSSKLFTEVGYCSGCWSQAQYDSITTGSQLNLNPMMMVPSPQIYNSAMAVEQNNSYADNTSYNTLVTCEGIPSSGIYSCLDATSLINGPAWTYSEWGNGNWVNKWVPV